MPQFLMKPLIDLRATAQLETLPVPETHDQSDQRMPQLFHLIPRRTMGARAIAAGKDTLILDHDPVIRERLGTYLWRRGYTVWPSANAVEAFAILKQESIDLVVLDLLLPGISGAEVIRVLRRRSGVKQPAIVILSALSSERSICEGLSIGADAYITKPVEVGVVEARIAAILRRRVTVDLSDRAATILDFPRPAC